MGEHRIWSNGQNTILNIFSTEFSKHFIKEPTVDIFQAIPLSRDIMDIDNEKVILNATNEEISQVVYQISQLKAPGLDKNASNFSPKKMGYFE